MIIINKTFGFLGILLGTMGITMFAYSREFWWWFLAVLVLWAGIHYFTKKEATP